MRMFQDWLLTVDADEREKRIARSAWNTAIESATLMVRKYRIDLEGFSVPAPALDDLADTIHAIKDKS